MTLLNDEQIVALLEADPSLLTNYEKPSDRYSKKSLVQPASLDLSMGEIYIPPEDNQLIKPDEELDPHSELTLKPGQTAIVTTLEAIRLPSHIAAFGFPPTTVSAKAILMTNPGHMDPGFSGHLAFTLINMGREDYPLVEGRKLVSLLLVRMKKSTPIS